MRPVDIRVNFETLKTLKTLKFWEKKLCRWNDPDFLELFVDWCATFRTTEDRMKCEAEHIVRQPALYEMKAS